MAGSVPSLEDLAARLPAEDRTDGERLVLARLMLDVLSRGPLPTHLTPVFPRFEALRRGIVAAIAGPVPGDQLEESFLELYAHLHLHEAPYSPEERARVTTTGGYWCHAGGVDPVVRAGRYLQPDWTSVDLGAGNGLQGLLLQLAFPHRRTVQIEISRAAVDIGRSLQSWLGVSRARVTWVVADLTTVPLDGFDFVYLYRPLRPEGPGREFYRRLATSLAAHPRRVVVFSVADCLGEFLDHDFELEFTTGHLTCFRRDPRAQRS